MKSCDYCGKPFLPNGIHITEKVNGKWKTFRACKMCTKELVTEDKDIKPIKKTDIEIELIGGGSPEELVKATEGIMELLDAPKKRPEFFNKAPCPHCDLTIEEFIKTGKFGCAYCYEHYDEEFVPIAMIHQDGNDRHMGKTPKAWRERQYNDPKELRKLLLLKKAKAVELEQYEEAAKFADEIRKLDSSSPP